MKQAAMPVKLSGDLVQAARRSAKRLRRSVTGQIEHWAAIGRAVESQLPSDALAELLKPSGAPMKITHVAQPDQRRAVMSALGALLSESTSPAWLSELSARGIPLYGTQEGQAGIVRRDPTGRETLVASESKSASR
jgi:hypothetical protein